MQSTSSSSAESENIIGLGESPELSIAAQEIPTAQEECANCAELMKENRKLKNSVKTLREIIVKRRQILGSIKRKVKIQPVQHGQLLLPQYPLNTIYPYIWSFSDFDIQV